MSEDNFKQPEVLEVVAEISEPEILPPVLREIPQTRHHVKDEQLGLQIRDMAGMGLSKSQCALAARISTRLLDKYYLEEYLDGQGRMQKGLASVAVAEAMNGNTPILLHLLKTKLGWSEQHQVEISGEVRSVVSNKPMTKDEFVARYLTSGES
jgi:hypothetical protein